MKGSEQFTYDNFTVVKSFIILQEVEEYLRTPRDKNFKHVADYWNEPIISAKFPYLKV